MSAAGIVAADAGTLCRGKRAGSMKPRAGG